jgi:NADPH:quinone reductase-like Zn-dependent oxidoreductase
MQALVINDFGAVEKVLALADIPQPVPGPDEVLLRFLAAPINPADLNWIEGTYGTRPVLPETPGTEGVAEVVESRTADFPVGQKVICLDHAHAWQQYRCAKADKLLAVPDDIDPLQLAMLKVNPATASLLLSEFSHLPPGSSVILNAANSGVGQCVIQIARERGIRTINFLRDSDKSSDLTELGADAVFTDDDAGLQAALEYCKQDQLEPRLALNAVGGESALRQLNLLANGGTQVTYGAMSRRPLMIPNKFLIFRDMRFRGFWLSAWLDSASHAEIQSNYEWLVGMIRQKKLHQSVDCTYSLGDHAKAFDRLGHPERRGKILFTP